MFIRNQQVLDELLKTQIVDDERKRKLAQMQSQLNLYMHSFTNDQLGIGLDQSIYTGFIKTKSQAPDLMIEEVDELDLDENGTNTTGHQMSVLVREQIEKFKGKMIDEIEGSPPVKRGFAGNISTDGL